MNVSIISDLCLLNTFIIDCKQRRVHSYAKEVFKKKDFFGDFRDDSLETAMQCFIVDHKLMRINEITRYDAND